MEDSWVSHKNENFFQVQPGSEFVTIGRAKGVRSKLIEYFSIKQ